MTACLNTNARQKTAALERPADIWRTNCDALRILINTFGDRLLG